MMEFHEALEDCSLNDLGFIEDESGGRTTSTEEIIKIASGYFEKLFSASDMGVDEHLFSLMEKKVTVSLNDILLRQFTEEEITYAIKIMAPLKSSGVDEFPAIFFQSYINEAQGAFILGRLISDNILIAYEVLHSLKMKKSGKRGKFALKLDIRKAYDRVEWDFLAGMIKYSGFYEDWIVLIMRCVCSVSYSVNLNGINGEWFSPARGLRQGDPLSPYIFMICAEGFSTLIQDAKKKGWMMGATVGVRVATNPEKYLGLPMMRVGSGTRINIWIDPWLPGRENNRVSVQEIRPTWMTVNQLIETESNTWNRELVHYLVDEDTVARIFSIPISGSSSEDILVWKHEGSDNEDLGHLVWSSDTLQNVWASLPVKIPPLETSLCCKNRFARTFSTADEHQKRVIAISIWGLWYCKNKQLHEGVKFLLQEFIGFIRGYEHELSLNQENLHPSLKVMVKDLWRPPDDGVIKINFDAAFQKEDKIATTAVLARDSAGEIVGVETYFIEEVVDAFVAEAQACERALIFATEMGFGRLIVDGDSLMVNRASHTLALEGQRRHISGSWVNGVLDSVKKIVMEDRLAWIQHL
ncbi:hypothetical protein J1N35_006025 [Gossypium stocksii]|uniref:Reverse transcriptase n=1 Tax=Gossypium stocksii TaxID=47602 RepID=A0A9D3WGW8_9ROSI|nr:hypothetical protein J1N35_006025 [Gossypium stocksii]